MSDTTKELRKMKSANLPGKPGQHRTIVDTQCSWKQCKALFDRQVDVRKLAHFRGTEDLGHCRITAFLSAVEVDLFGASHTSSKMRGDKLERKIAKMTAEREMQDAEFWMRMATKK